MVAILFYFTNEKGIKKEPYFDFDFELEKIWKVESFFKNCWFYFHGFGWYSIWFFLQFRW